MPGQSTEPLGASPSTHNHDSVLLICSTVLNLPMAADAFTYARMDVAVRSERDRISNNRPREKSKKLRFSRPKCAYVKVTRITAAPGGEDENNSGLEAGNPLWPAEPIYGVRSLLEVLVGGERLERRKPDVG